MPGTGPSAAWPPAWHATCEVSWKEEDPVTPRLTEEEPRPQRSSHWLGSQHKQGRDRIQSLVGRKPEAKVLTTGVLFSFKCNLEK